ncbi:MAG: oligosaccharide flippase family protein [Candidatus Gribaldobacteria bacterium]|nr:oligosaccharide flippase family protein [Candidatus Gribaldobacteria bacterium]
MIQTFKQKIYGLLKKTEKYTQTDNIYLAKNGFWLTSAKLIVALSSFLTAVAFANLLAPELYGNYKYIVTLVGFLSIFTLKGLCTALSQAVTRGLEGGLHSLFKTKIKFACLQSLGVIILGIYYFHQSNYLLALPLFFIAFLLPLLSGFGLFSFFLLGQKNFRLNAKYQIIQSLVTAGSLIAFLLLVARFPQRALLIIFTLTALYFSTQTICNGIFYYLTKKKLTNNTQDPKTKKYGFHLTIVNFLEEIIGYLDQILVFHSLGAIQLAMYSFALLPVNKLKEPVQMISDLALPKFSVKNPAELKKDLPLKISKLLLLMLPIMAFYWLIAPFVFKFFFPLYTGAIFYSQIYVFSLLGVGYLISNTALTSQMAIKKIYAVKISTAVLDILLLVGGFWWLGILGIIIARVASEIIRTIIGLIIIKKL